MLKKGAKPDDPSTSSGATALQFAAQFGHKKIIERLLTTKNLDVDAADHQGMTALHLAISRGYKDICRYLIDNGASIDISTKQGHTCLHLATNAGSTDIVDLVIKTGRCGSFAKSIVRKSHILTIFTVWVMSYPNIIYVGQTDD